MKKQMGNYDYEEIRVSKPRQKKLAMNPICCGQES